MYYLKWLWSVKCVTEARCNALQRKEWNVFLLSLNALLNTGFQDRFHHLSLLVIRATKIFSVSDSYRFPNVAGTLRDDSCQLSIAYWTKQNRKCFQAQWEHYLNCLSHRNLLTYSKNFPVSVLLVWICLGFLHFL